MIYEFLYKNAEKFFEKTVSDGFATITFRELFKYAEKYGEILKTQPERKFGILCAPS